MEKKLKPKESFVIEVTFKGQSVHVNGPLPKIGVKAPGFALVDQQLEEVSLASFGSKRKLLNVFVSLDTSVCSQSIHTFYKEASSIDDLAILNISLDLPFAASRFCQQEKLENVITLSAFRSSFPDDYGVRIVDGKLKNLCARAVFVLDGQNIVLHSQLVPEITHEPNYDAAIDVLKG